MRPTFKIVLFSRANNGGLRPVMLRVTFLRRSRYYNLHRYCLPEQFDAASGRLRKNFPGWRLENDMLRTYEQRASDALREFERDMRRFNFAAFERMVFGDRANGAQEAWAFVQSVADGLADIGKAGNALFYRDSAKVVRAFAPAATLHDVDGNWLDIFERWMRKNRKFTDGGMALVMRTLRAAFNRAEKSGAMPKGWQPFAGYSFSHLKNVRGQKAIPLEKMWELRDIECRTKAERFALDMFLFSFYARGMNFADMAELRHSDVRDFRIWYARKKTGRQYSIPLVAAMGAILDRYKGGERLFPVYGPEIKTEAQKLERRTAALKSVNESLKTIAKRSGIPEKGFSFYVARHTYANAHKQAGTPAEVIMELMGHADFKTSEAYLSAFGDTALDAADSSLFGQHG